MVVKFSIYLNRRVFVMNDLERLQADSEPQVDRIIFMEFDNEIIYTTFFPFPLIQEGQLLVTDQSNESMCTSTG